MPATPSDMSEVRSLVFDATLLLDWSSGEESLLLDEDTEETRPVVVSQLADSYRAAINQAREEAFQLALMTLRGGNPNFPAADIRRLAGGRRILGGVRLT